MNRMSFYHKVLSLIILSCLSISAYAWYNPTHTYSAKVQVGFSNSSPTGSGLVYATQDKNSPVAESAISWSDEGSEGGNSSETENAELPVFLYAKANNGYRFDGWSDSPTGTPMYAAISPFKKEYTVGNNRAEYLSYYPYVRYPYRQATYSIFAFFSAIPYSITYLHGDKGTGDSYQSMYNIAGTGTELTPGDASGFTPITGYQFSNKWVVSNATGNWTNGTEIASNYSFANNKMFGDITLTALWEHKPYSITYVVGTGGSLKGGSSPQRYYIDEATTLRYATKTGNTFYGWKVTSIADPTECNWSVGDVIPYNGSSPVVPAGKYGNITLTAQWEPLPADIIINVSGMGSGESAIFNVSKGGTVLYTVAVSASSPSVTIKNLEVGDYTVTATNWNISSSLTPSASTQTISAPSTTFSFTASPLANPKNNDEKANVNWHE